MAPPVNGPPNRMSKVSTRPIDSPAILVNGPRSSMAVPYTANTRKNVRIASSATARPFVVSVWFTWVVPRWMFGASQNCFSTTTLSR